MTGEQIRLVYTIDMQNDIVEKISFSTGEGEGELTFSYLQDLNDIGSEFTHPKAGRYRGAQDDSPGILWFLKLINNNF